MYIYIVILLCKMLLDLNLNVKYIFGNILCNIDNNNNNILCIVCVMYCVSVEL